jgi:hypothetical protein
MRKIIAKFNSNCHETGEKIKKGDQVIYDPYIKKAYSLSSSKAAEYNNSPDPAAGAIQAEQDSYFDNFCRDNNI